MTVIIVKSGMWMKTNFENNDIYLVFQLNTAISLFVKNVTNWD